MSAPDSHVVSDAVRGHWADRYLPGPAKPYARLARLERPIGWWLLLWPGWWSLALAARVAGDAWPDLRLLVLFLIGAVVMRGAGCTFNDIVDREIDAQVTRTRSRPIPSGQVTVTRAFVFLAVLLAIGLAVLTRFNDVAIAVGVASVPVIAVYPFMKRFMNWPQLVLGIAFSWGALLGWAAALGRLDTAPVLLYLGGILWTVGYDTIYAHQDRADDELIGVKSTARTFGGHTRGALAAFYGGAIALFAAAAVAAGAGWPAFVGLLAGAVHLGWQVATLDPDDPDRCLRRFRSNRDFGWIVFAGFVADAALAAA